LSADIPNNGANTSGNAATATALAALPTPCTGQAATGILANGNSTGCFTPVVTNSRPVRHYTMGQVVSNNFTSSAEWDGSNYCCSQSGFYSGISTLTGWSLPYNGTSGTANWVQLRVGIPVGWTGTVSLKAFWALVGPPVGNTGTGTGTHNYQVACLTPGFADFGVAPTMSTAVAVAFSFTGTTYKTGVVDNPTLNLPTCAAGDTMLIRMTRVITGTSIDSTSLNYYDVALPYTVQ
jgi:hypothetical protein